MSWVFWTAALGEHFLYFTNVYKSIGFLCTGKKEQKFANPSPSNSDVYMGHKNINLMRGKKERGVGKNVSVNTSAARSHFRKNIWKGFVDARYLHQQRTLYTTCKYNTTWCPKLIIKIAIHIVCESSFRTILYRFLLSVKKELWNVHAVSVQNRTKLVVNF